MKFKTIIFFLLIISFFTIIFVLLSKSKHKDYYIKSNNQYPLLSDSIDYNKCRQQHCTSYNKPWVGIAVL